MRWGAINNLLLHYYILTLWRTNQDIPSCTHPMTYKPTALQVLTPWLTNPHSPWCTHPMTCKPTKSFMYSHHDLQTHIPSCTHTMTSKPTQSLMYSPRDLQNHTVLDVLTSWLTNPHSPSCTHFSPHDLQTHTVLHVLTQQMNDLQIHSDTYANAEIADSFLHTTCDVNPHCYHG